MTHNNSTDDVFYSVKLWALLFSKKKRLEMAFKRDSFFQKSNLGTGFTLLGEIMC